MLWNNFLGEHDKLRYMTTALSFLLAVSLLGNLAEGFLVYSLAKSKRTIITPSHIAAQMEVSDFEGDPSYIRQMAIYAVELLYQYTPYNAAPRFQEFLINFVPTKNIDLLRVQLQGRLRQIQETKVSESLHVEELIFEKKNTVLMTGFLNRFTAGQQIGNEKIYLELEYRIVNGGLRIEVIRNISSQTYNTRARLLTDTERKQVKSTESRNERAKKAGADNVEQPVGDESGKSGTVPFDQGTGSDSGLNLGPNAATPGKGGK
ncbi:MAG: type IV conjugative transfer system protein TraE [Desulfovibrio sp.]|jgi:type IV conjugative transfer system protein TraE|nr:type IV conjugative transfer system protein TraE [Desulfovibrio sp.]